jgi:hypothetical protein
VSPMTLGVVYAALGRTDDALDAIERSVQEHDCWVVALGVEPAYDALRGNPRFEALVDRVGIMEVHHASATLDVSGKNRVPA